MMCPFSVPGSKSSSGGDWMCGFIIREMRQSSVYGLRSSDGCGKGGMCMDVQWSSCGVGVGVGVGGLGLSGGIESLGLVCQVAVHGLATPQCLAIPHLHPHLPNRLSCRRVAI